MLFSLLLAAQAPVAVAAPVIADAGLIVGAIRPGSGAGDHLVELVRLNRAAAADPYAFPARIAARVAVSGKDLPVTLERVDAAGIRPIVPGGFAQARYRLTLPAAAGGGMGTLSLSGEGSRYAFAIERGDVASAYADVPERRDDDMQVAQAETAPAPPPAFNPDPPSAKPDTGNAFLGNLSTYTPIYAVYGPGTNTDGRIQIGFKYQLFGQPGAVGPGHSWANGIHFGYSQRLFWDLGAESKPFRNVEYLPELFYLMPARPVGDGRIQLGGQAGIRHESNGRDGLDSRSLNTIYVQPIATTQVGEYTLTVGPRAWLYVGDLEDNPDIRRFRGNTGLLAEIGKPDGWRLTTTSRFNFGSAKGSFDAEASYPLQRIFNTGLNLYVFGQGFVGYGENLFDYNRRATRLRVGFGFVR